MKLRRGAKKTKHEGIDERLRAVIESLPVMLCALDEWGRFIVWNRECERVSGYSAEEIAGNPRAFELLCSDPLQRARMIDGWTRGRRWAGEWEIDLSCRDHGLRTVAWTNQTQRNPVPGWAAWFVGIDVTEHKRAKRESYRAQERYRRLAEHAQDLVWRTDAEGTLIYVNEAARRILGLPPSQAIGRPPEDFFPPESLDKIRWAIRRAFHATPPREGFRVEVEHLRPRDEPVQVEINATLVRDERGRLIAIDGITRDISERIRADQEKAELEAQLRQSQKMEAVGRLAGGVAHDFNNLLTVIAMAAESLSEEIPNWDPRLESIEDLREATQRAQALTRQLLAFSRKEVARPRRLDLRQVVLGLEKMLRRLLDESIELVIRCLPSPVVVLADPGLIEQALMNLVVNARDAMSQGGKLTIELTTEELAIGQYARLAVSDTGVGMDEETRAMIFEPFFTTKEAGKGTGLGLSTVYGIVTGGGGRIEVDSVLGGGTSIVILWPALAEQETSTPPPLYREAAEQLDGDETVLLVEDEELVRRITAGVLRCRGYRVLEAASGADALAEARSINGALDLLLTDVVLPGQNGPQLADKIRESCPKARVLYMSGYTDDMIHQLGVRAEGSPFIAKPFKPQVLLSKVREVLGG